MGVSKNQRAGKKVVADKKTLTPHNYYGFNSFGWASVTADSIEDATKALRRKLELSSNQALTVREM